MALTKIRPRMISGAPVSVLDFGAVGDAVTDCTAALNSALATGRPVDIPAGVFRITNGIDLPAGAKIRGAGAPALGVFPQTADDKRFLRPGYKTQLPGSVLLFTGTGVKSATTARVDRFSSFTYAMRTTTANPVSLEGFGIVMDMDVFDAAGVLTAIGADNRASYGVGYMCGADTSYHRDLCIFGYWPKAGLMIHGADPDYITFDGGSSSGDIGCAIVGNNTNGLSGTQFYGWSFFANDHHSRSIDGGGQWGTTALYIDGAVSATAPNANISGHYIFGGAVRTYADNPLSFGACNSAVFTGVVFEWPNMVGSVGATIGKPLATADTFGVVFDACRHLSPIGTDAIYSMAQTMGGVFVHTDARYGSLGIAGAGGGVLLRGGTAGQNPRVQMATDINGSTNGWVRHLDTSAGSQLQDRYSNVTRFAVDPAGGQMSLGFAYGGIKTIAADAIVAGGYNYYAIDTEAAAAGSARDVVFHGEMRLE